MTKNKTKNRIKFRARKIYKQKKMPKLVTYIITIFSSWGTTFIPQLRPVNIAFVSSLTLQWFSPLILSITSVWGATLGTLLQRHLYESFIAKRVSQKVEKAFNKTEKTKKLYQKIQNAWSQKAMFVASCAIFYSPIPDIVIIILTRQKIKFWRFLAATIIGKLWVYVPYIIGVESIQQLWILTKNLF